LLPKRWIVEKTFAWLSQSRRFSKLILGIRSQFFYNLRFSSSQAKLHSTIQRSAPHLEGVKFAFPGNLHRARPPRM
jgi:hypothetical protein